MSRRKRLIHSKKLPLRVSSPLLGLTLVVVIMAVLTVFSSRKQNVEKTPLPATASITTLDAIIPGSTTDTQLAHLENRFATRNVGEKTLILIGRDTSFQYSTIEISQGLVSAVIIANRQHIQYGTLDEFSGAYGAADRILYGPWQESGFLSYVYLKPGVIVVAHQSTGEIIEVWKIPKELSFDQFNRQFGDRFSTEPNVESHF